MFLVFPCDAWRRTQTSEGDRGVRPGPETVVLPQGLVVLPAAAASLHVGANRHVQSPVGGGRYRLTPGVAERVDETANSRTSRPTRGRARPLPGPGLAENGQRSPPMHHRDLSAVVLARNHGNTGARNRVGQRDLWRFSDSVLQPEAFMRCPVAEALLSPHTRSSGTPARLKPR